MLLRALVASGLAGLFVFAAASTASATDAPDGVVCRTKSSQAGTTELVLHWEGASARGTLQRIALSGNMTSQNVRAERHDGMIIADDVFEKDLTSHAAVVTVKNGKRYMRTENVWLACE